MSGYAYEGVEAVALASRGDKCALHEEFVLAFDGERRVLLHGLEQHWQSVSNQVEYVREKRSNFTLYFYALSRFYPARVWTDTVLLLGRFV